ncbi:MAG: alpha/beta hydrolase family esterase [Flavobacteriaceae bacterium]|tara:strand:- start:298 stop:1146 length:849 start_codon:yes stop_codon:yes gene_type:complete
MKKLIYKLIFFFLVVSCNNSNSDNNSDNLNEVLTTKTITIEQVLENDITILRPVIIQTPNQVDLNKNYPVVFAYHGRGGSNNSWVNQLSSYTNSGEFIGIYPQGYLQSWNLGPEPSNADDVEFTNLIIEELQNYNNIDFEKIYAIGTSNGSGMVNKLGIETNHFKAIAPIVSQLIESLPILETTNPISVFQVNGALDTTIPIEGGPQLGHVFLDAYESAELWANQFNCSENPTIITLGDDTLYVFDSCDNGREVQYLRIENGGHNLALHILFPEIWEFFQRF